MVSKSFLVAVSAVVWSYSSTAFAQQNLFKELARIDAKASEIRELLIGADELKPIKADELRDLQCVSYARPMGYPAADDHGNQIFLDVVSGQAVSKVEQYPYPRLVPVYNMPLMESSENNRLVVFQSGAEVMAGFPDCMISLVKVGYRILGESSCSKLDGQKVIGEPSVYSDDLQAIDYIECARPSTLI